MYQLSTINYQLSTINYQLSTINYQLIVKLFLIGFMGCGKSYVGRLLAAKLGFQFVDADTVIENTEGAQIAEIFAKQGEAYFRKTESEVLRRFQKWDNIVVATGGGAPCFHDSMDWMNENGITVYLKAPPKLLLSRLKSETDHRPVLAGRTDADLLHFIEQKLEERNPFYTKATLTIEQMRDGEHIVIDIINSLYSRVADN
jgi:shikimate kinase